MDRQFGILCDSYLVKKWQYVAISKILSETSYKLNLIVINEQPKTYKIDFKNLFFYLYKLLFTSTKQTTNNDIRNLIQDVATKRICVIKKGRFSEYFKHADIDYIKSYKLDFILRFGFGIIRGEILNSAKYGIWSFHHGDNQKYRGGPYGFWEIFKKDYNTGSILQILTDKLDGGIILRKGYFKTRQYSYSANIDHILQMSSHWPSQICKAIETNSFAIPNEASNTDAKIYKLPSNFQMIEFVIKIILNKIKHYYYKYLTYDHWQIGIIKKPIEQVLFSQINNKHVKWFNYMSKSFFVADPFIFQKDEKLLLAVEKLPYNSFKGEIEVFENFDTNPIKINEFSINKDFHLSYPNPIHINQSIYLLPESYEDNCLALYDLNNNMKKHKLINNIKCLDSEILLFNNKYWIFTTIKGNNHETNLHIFYADTIFSQWKPHLMNPVVSDVRSARGAGKIIIIDKELYRPGQNYSKFNEGSVTVSKIVKLTPNEYEENIVNEILPILNSDYPDKIHSISGVGNLTVIDACRMKSFLLRPDILRSLVRYKLFR